MNASSTKTKEKAFQFPLKKFGNFFPFDLNFQLLFHGTFFVWTVFVVSWNFLGGFKKKINGEITIT
jgi:hypothetical protein